MAKEKELVIKLRADVAAFNAGMSVASAGAAKFGVSTQLAGTMAAKGFQLATQAAKNFQMVKWGAAAGGIAAVGFAAVKMASMVKSALSSSIAEAIKFERAWADALRTVGGSSKELSVLREDLLELSTHIPVAATEMARLASVGGQMGIAAPQIKEFVDVTARMAETFEMNGEQAAMMLARIGQVNQIPVDQYRNLASSIVSVADAYNTNAQEMMRMLMQMQGLGAQAGMTAQQMIALSGILVSSGIRIEAGGTALGRAARNIGIMVTEGGAQLELLGKTSKMSAEEFANAWKTDKMGAFFAFFKGLQDAGERSAFILKALNLHNIRVSSGINAAARSLKDLKDAFALANSAMDEGTSLAWKSGLVFATTEKQIEVYKNSLARARIEAGTEFLPVLKEITRVATEVARELALLANGNKEYIKSFADSLGFLAGIPDAIRDIGNAAAWTADRLQLLPGFSGAKNADVKGGLFAAGKGVLNAGARHLPGGGVASTLFTLAEAHADENRREFNRKALEGPMKDYWSQLGLLPQVATGTGPLKAAGHQMPKSGPLMLQGVDWAKRGYEGFRPGEGGEDDAPQWLKDLVGDQSEREARAKKIAAMVEEMSGKAAQAEVGMIAEAIAAVGGAAELSQGALERFGQQLIDAKLWGAELTPELDKVVAKFKGLAEAGEKIKFKGISKSEMSSLMSSMGMGDKPAYTTDQLLDTSPTQRVQWARDMAEAGAKAGIGFKDMKSILKDVGVEGRNLDNILQEIYATDELSLSIKKWQSLRELFGTIREGLKALGFEGTSTIMQVTVGLESGAAAAQTWQEAVKQGSNTMKAAAVAGAGMAAFSSGSFLGGAASGAMSGAAMGGPWGALIGGVAGGVLGLFGKGKREAEERKAAMDELTKSIVSQYGSLEEAAEKAAEYGIELEKALSGGDPKKVEAALSALDAKMKEAAKKAAGLETARGGLGAVVEGVDWANPEMAKAAATTFSAVFWATVKEKGFIQAVESMRPVWSKMLEGLKEAGLNPRDVGLGGVGGLLKVAQDEQFKKSAGAASGMAQVMSGMTDAGMVDQKLLGAGTEMATQLQDQATAAAEKAGMKPAAATKAGFQAIAPLLQAQVDAAIASGQGISDELQALLDQAKENGVHVIADPMLQQLDELRGIHATLKGQRLGGGRGAPVRDFPTSPTGRPVPRSRPPDVSAARGYYSDGLDYDMNFDVHRGEEVFVGAPGTYAEVSGQTMGTGAEPISPTTRSVLQNVTAAIASRPAAVSNTIENPVSITIVDQSMVKTAEGQRAFSENVVGEIQKALDQNSRGLTSRIEEIARRANR